LPDQYLKDPAQWALVEGTGPMNKVMPKLIDLGRRASRLAWGGMLAVSLIGQVQGGEVKQLGGEPGGEPGGKRILGEICCQKSVSYQIGAGPWISRVEGTFPVVLPLRVKVQGSPCRVLIPGRGLFEASEGAVFQIAEDPTRQMELKIEQGSVIYSLPQGQVLRIEQPLANARALVGSGTATPAKNHAIQFQAVSLGMAKVDSGRRAEFANIQGSMAISTGAGTAKSLARGQILEVGSDGREVAKPLGGGKTPGETAGIDANLKNPITLDSWKIFQTPSQTVVHSPARMRMASTNASKDDKNNGNGNAGDNNKNGNNKDKDKPKPPHGRPGASKDK
jgi:hypothetical protein